MRNSGSQDLREQFNVITQCHHSHFTAQTSKHQHRAQPFNELKDVLFPPGVCTRKTKFLKYFLINCTKGINKLIISSRRPIILWKTSFKLHLNLARFYYSFSHIQNKLPDSLFQRNWSSVCITLFHQLNSASKNPVPVIYFTKTHPELFASLVTGLAQQYLSHGTPVPSYNRELLIP